MNILSYEVRADRVIVRTDNLSRPVFNYSRFQFGSLDALRAEIERSIAMEANRLLIPANNWDNLHHDFVAARVNEHIEEVGHP